MEGGVVTKVDVSAWVLVVFDGVDAQETSNNVVLEDGADLGSSSISVAFEDFGFAVGICDDGELLTIE